MGLRQRFFREVRIYWVNVLYITAFLGIFTNYRRLILAHYRISYGDYGISLIKALILGKVILIIEKLHIGRGFEDRPLIIPTLYKSILFTFCVAVFSIVESLIRGYFIAKSLSGVYAGLIERFSYEWYAEILVIFFAFIPFFAFRELGRVMGESKIRDIFLRGPNS